MKNKLAGKLFALMAVVLMGAMMCSYAEAKADYKLTLAMYDPAQSKNTQYQEKWAEQVKEATNGAVEIQIYPGGTLCSATDTLDAIKTGVADMGWIFTSFYPNQFPFIDVVTLPMMGIDHAAQATNVLWDLFETEEVVQNELKDFQMLMLFTNNSNVIGTSKKPIKTFEDIAGLKLRSPTGAATSMVKAWNANPIAMGPGDMFQAMQKGVIDGYVFEYAGIGNYALTDLTKYYTEINLYVGPFMLLMNKDKWAALPEDIQKQILSVSGRDTSIGAAMCFADDGDATRDKEVAKGKEMITLSPEEYARFKVAADEYNAAWVAEHTKDGVDTKAFYDKAVELVQKYKMK